MKIQNLVDEMSTLYRETLQEISDIKGILRKLESQKYEEENINHFQNIFYADFLSLETKIKFNTNLLKDKEIYARGIFDAREILLNYDLLKKIKE